MDAILDNFNSEKLFPNSNLLDLEDLNETDFLTNVVRSGSVYSFIKLKSFENVSCLHGYVFHKVQCCNINIQCLVNQLMCVFVLFELYC